MLRPGRFDRHVVLPNPDVRGRKEILEIHTRNKPLDKVVTLETLAKMTPGFSGADLFNLVNEGAILAARRNKKTIAQLRTGGGDRPRHRRAGTPQPRHQRARESHHRLPRGRSRPGRPHAGQL